MCLLCEGGAVIDKMHPIDFSPSIQFPTDHFFARTYFYGIAALLGSSSTLTI